MNSRQTTISARINEALNIRRMKQIELAERSGLTRSAISSYIAERWEPKQEAIHKLAVALDVNEAWLMGFDVPMERDSLSQSNVKPKNDINGYYIDPDAAEYAEECRTNPNIRVLFSASKGITKEQMEKTVEYIEFLKAKEKPQEPEDFVDDFSDDGC